jgi:hypothetical protein
MACLPFKTYVLDPFEFQIYGCHTQGKGNLDPELLSSYIVAGHKEGDGGTSPTFASQSIMRYAIELEYGLTDKIDFAYYLNLARPDGGDLQYAGSKFRFRGRFAEAGELPVDTVLRHRKREPWWTTLFLPTFYLIRVGKKTCSPYFSIFRVTHSLNYKENNNEKIPN